jgi:hypothetical protein
MSTPHQLSFSFEIASASVQKQAQALELRLAAALGAPLRLRLTNNRSTMISSSRTRGRLEVRLHHMFLDADAATVGALARYVSRRDRRASATLGTFIENRRRQIAPPRYRVPTLRTAGAHHDLATIGREVNDAYFGGSVDASVTWGRRPSLRRRRRSRRTIRLGTYCSDGKLVRVHPALDQPFVPRYFVAYIVFHEMLHHVMPMPMTAGRRQVHTKEFKAREATFEHYERAIKWEKRYVHRLLG